MTIEIEVYKDQTIYYDIDSDKFICDISIEDKSKSTKRQSLRDVRREIDSFVKLNLEFKPFRAIEKSQWGEDFRIVDIVAIRTDGKLVKKGTYNSLLDKKDCELLMVYDSDIVEEFRLSEEKLSNARKEYEETKKLLCSRLVKMDLSKYDLK